MKVHNVEMIMSAVRPEQYPTEGYPEFALAGRSNVGKSSFINKMIGRKSLARTSSKPGKTQTLNFYKIEEKLFFVDVPGYGYAKVSKTEKEKWGGMIEQYITSRRIACGSADCRFTSSTDKRRLVMHDFLTHYNIPQLSLRQKRIKYLKVNGKSIRKSFAQHLTWEIHEPLILFSSEKGMGMDEAWREIESRM